MTCHRCEHPVEWHHGLTSGCGWSGCNCPQFQKEHDERDRMERIARERRYHLLAAASRLMAAEVVRFGKTSSVKDYVTVVIAMLEEIEGREKP